MKKGLVFSLMLALVLVHSTDAGAGRGWSDRGSSDRGSSHKHHKHHRDRNWKGNFWGGVLGGIGATIWAQANRPGRDREFDEMTPWSPRWYEYCSNRYRSFDPRTGTYLGHDGFRHACK